MKGSIRKKGSSYYYRIHSDNVNIERYAGKTKKEAYKALREALVEFDDTQNVFKGSSITFGELLDQWLETVQPTIKHGTYVDYRNVIANHLKKEKFSKRKIGTISIQILQEYINKKFNVLSASTMKSHFVVLNKSFAYAVYPMGYIKESPMHYVKRPKIAKDELLDLMTSESEQVKTITLDEYNQILSCLKNNYVKLVFQIGFYTGARLGEICALTWEDIDLNNQKITIKKNLFYNGETKSWELGKTKNGKIRIVDISNQLEKILREAKKLHLTDQIRLGQDYVQSYVEVSEFGQKTHLTVTDKPTDYKTNFVCVHASGKPITNQYVKTCITRYVRKGGTGIDFHFHMLRHTHATMLLQSGIDMKEVQERLGHTKIATTMDIYAHTTAESRKRTADIFDQLLASI